MLIRSKLIRPDGTHVTLGKGDTARKYHFKPQDQTKPDRDHVCEVEQQEDIATFLAIKEGYEIHPSEIKAKPAPVNSQTQAHTQAAASTVLAGAQTGGASTDAADAAKTANVDAPAYDKLSKPQLIEELVKRGAKKPHPSTSAAKLIEALKALDAADAAKK